MIFFFWVIGRKYKGSGAVSGCASPGRDERRRRPESMAENYEGIILWERKEEKSKSRVVRVAGLVE